MINDSPTSLAFIRTTITLLQSIGPLCLLWTTWRITTSTTTSLLEQNKLPSPSRPSALQTYALSEATFYLLSLLHTLYLQRRAEHPPLRTRAQRQQLFETIRGEIRDVEKFLSGWFRGARVEEIGRGDLRSFLDWSFWEGRFVGEEGDEEEMEGYVNGVEGLVGRGFRFREGKGRVRPLRLTLDPVEVQVRCLVWYAIVLLVDLGVFVKFWWCGWGFRGTSAVDGRWVFPPRPLALLGGKSEAEGLSYWVREHTAKDRLPVLFIHGIGVGLHPYVDTLVDLSKRADKSTNTGSVGILAIELLPISSRLTSPILHREDFLRQITTILASHSPHYDSFILASHSYGSVFTTYMLTDPLLAPRVHATVLIDPVTLLLYQPDVAYNFTARAPKTANEWQLWYFASKDPGVAHTLARHFFWSESCLWRERVGELLQRGMRITLSLAGRDLIVDTEAVAGYLSEDEVEGKDVRLETEDGGLDGKKKVCVKGLKERPWMGQGLDVLWFEDLDHAQVFDDEVARERLVRVIVGYTKLKG